MSLKWAKILLFCGIALLIFSFILDIECGKITVSQTRTVTVSATLYEGENLIVPAFGYRYSGPYTIEVGKTIVVTWHSDIPVNVDIYKISGYPEYAGSIGTSGTVTLKVRYPGEFQIRVWTGGWQATLYHYEEKLTWDEILQENVEKPITCKDYIFGVYGQAITILLRALGSILSLLSFLLLLLVKFRLKPTDTAYSTAKKPTHYQLTLLSHPTLSKGAPNHHL